MPPQSFSTFLIRLLISPALLGTIFFLIGKYLSNRPPKTINRYSGYRTPRSMLNQDTWDEANRFSSSLMTRLGAFALLLGLLCALLIPSFAFIGAASTLISLAAAGILIIRTEKHLRLLFDDKGGRR